jgi:putative transcriptional regulator
MQGEWMYDVIYTLHHSFTMDLHNRLKERRLKRNLTQEALAEVVGVTRQTIIAVEKEKFVPSVRLALELAQALNVPLGDLFWLERRSGGKR